MKHLQIALALTVAWLLAPLVATAQEPAPPACRPPGVCDYLSNYLCCRQGYCGKPAPCPPLMCLGCGPAYCEKPLPCPPCFPLKWCCDGYIGKPAPCCIPKSPCPPCP